MTIHIGAAQDVLQTLPDQSVHCIVTSPPYYGLRDYGVPGQFGLESTPDAYIANLVGVMREARRVLRDDGTLWLNLGDAYVSKPPGNKLGQKSGDGLYSRKLDMQVGHGEDRKAIWACGASTGLPEKNLIGMPWRVALALQADGWILRQDIIWQKPNPMPESVRDRCTKSHEYIFMLSKKPKYHFDHLAFQEPALRPEGAGNKTHKHETAYNDGDERLRTKANLTKVGPRATRNKRSVWTVSTRPFKGAHFATFPPDLIRPCVQAGCPVGGTVLDPFFGAGTTGLVARQEGREYIGIELNPAYAEMAQKRIDEALPPA